MFTQSPDRRIIVLSAITVVLIFLALNLHYTGGQIVLPLDDSYIYAQYAKAIADGHPFRYTPGAEPSTGTTGLLYAFLLAPFYLTGLRGDLFPVFIFLLNGVFFVISALLVYELAGAEKNRDTARFSAWLFILAGPMAWGFLTGMEIGLFVTTWLALALALQRGKETPAIILASTIALIRPAGLLWCLILWLALPYTEKRTNNKNKTRLKWLIPLAAGSLTVLVNLAIAGSLTPASGHPKSPFYLPGFHLPTILQHITGFLLTVFKHLLTGFSGPDLHADLNTLDTMCHVAPFTLLFLLLALVPVLGKVLSKGKPGVAGKVDKKVLWALWFLGGILWIAFTTGSTGHFFRHLLPVWPALILLTVEGISVLSHSLKMRGFSQEGIFRGFGVYLLLFGLLSTVNFALMHGQAAYGFARQYLDTARWVDKNLPKDARIASLDAGLLAYYSNREFFDLFGLTTPAIQEVTVFYADDEGTKYEVMERLPAQLRPTHFVLHHQRFDHNNWNPYRGLMKVDADNNAIIVHSARVLSQANIIGRNLQVWEADWSLVNTGDRPGGAAGGVITDRVDIADPVSEREHGVEITVDTPGFLGSNHFRRLASEDGGVIMDGGRGISGSLSMRFTGIQPGKNLVIRMRILPIAFNNNVRVEVNGRPLGNWTLPVSGKGKWLEPSIVIKSPIITSDSIDITLSGLFMPFHIWAIQ
ncbi:MAG: hypothetical protein GY950_19835 [bacterium]|nr:hypothetical protein [bacterium]